MWGGTISLITNGQVGEGTQWVKKKQRNNNGSGDTEIVQQDEENQSTEATIITKKMSLYEISNAFLRKVKEGVMKPVSEEIIKTMFRDEWERLNYKEKDLIKEALSSGDIIQVITIRSNAIIAATTAKKYYPNNKGKGNNHDAFRHALWQALNVQKLGENVSRDFSNAHEYSTPKNEINTDLYMDIHNNEVGIEIGKKLPKASLEELSQIIVDKISSGDMIIISDNGNLIKSNGNQLQSSEIRGSETALKIAEDLINS